jgi:serine protease Do
LGKKVPATIKRGSKEMKLDVTPTERSEIYPKQKEIKQWGLTARNISYIAAKEMKRDNQDGALVTTVRPGGPAGESKPSIDSGDIIVKVGDKTIKSVQDLLDVTKALTDGKTDPVPVVVAFERRASRYLAVVRVGIQELKDPGLEVTKAWLPVETQVISRDIARQLEQPALKGFYITRVYDDTSASKAGLKAGDFIVALDGEKLTATGPEHSDELATLIRQYDVGKTVDLTILRDKEEKKISVELARSARLQREMKKYRNDEFEFTVRDVSFFDAAQQQWDSDQRGALVDEVKSGSWAELGSLYVSDLIVSVDGDAIDNVEMLRKKMEQIAERKPGVVVMKVKRGIHTAFLELEPNWKN